MLKHIALRLFGAAVSSRLGATLVMRYAFRTPHRHLHDLDGGLYMGRWRVVDEGTLGSRILQALTGYSSVRLHRIMRPDHDRDLHNHPFEYRTFVVRGFYAEVYQDGQHGHPHYQFIQVGGTARATGRKFHCIDMVPRDGVWTLFFMTRNTGTWGFNVAGSFVQSTRYLLRKGYARTQIKEVQTL